MSESLSVSTFKSIWNEYREQIDDSLADYMQLSEDCPSSLQASMSYSLLAGGKRLRPLLVLLACEACGGDVESSMPAACAIEMIHTYSLIHDDLPAMDDDDFRRGLPTNHQKYGEATAILAGDGLLTLAFEILSRDISPPEIAVRCIVDLARASGVSGMVAGQVVDLESEHIAQPTLEQLQSIHRRKTGALLTSALTLGGTIAGAPKKVLRSLKQYGQFIGMAFQITDDLLDIQGDSAKMGKSVQKDAEQGKLTYPALLGVNSSRQQASDYVTEACRQLIPLGERAQRLEALAKFILERDH